LVRVVVGRYDSEKEKVVTERDERAKDEGAEPGHDAERDSEECEREPTESPASD
jgi:hypothetical protein